MAPSKKKSKSAAKKRAKSVSKKRTKTTSAAPQKKAIASASTHVKKNEFVEDYETMADLVDPKFLKKQMSLPYGERYEHSLAALPMSWRFELIIVEPPWHELFRTKSDVTLKNFTDLPVASMASRSGCSLFLWTPSAFFPEALDVLLAWGFKYVGVWYITIDLATKRTNFLIWGQSSPKSESSSQDLATNTKRNGDSLMESIQKRKAQPAPHLSIDHSSETAEKKIRRLLGPASRLRLFASDREEAGWSSWGPDVPGFYQEKPSSG